eukprot:TRINITY_DN59023_c0_g1_i1.p1 TRINITY_DN59023_c0_g1~~TRINITY_DN59023_c0_g1_i1.p1  ORF type:complete len:546 (-),score=145.76 TRINITY_DN59023_c0_g1_i1:42-1679(-)
MQLSGADKEERLGVRTTTPLSSHGGDSHLRIRGIGGEARQVAQPPSSGTARRSELDRLGGGERPFSFDADDVMPTAVVHRDQGYHQPAAESDAVKLIPAMSTVSVSHPRAAAPPSGLGKPALETSASVFSSPSVHDCQSLPDRRPRKCTDDVPNIVRSGALLGDDSPPAAPHGVAEGGAVGVGARVVRSSAFSDDLQAAEVAVRLSRLRFDLVNDEVRQELKAALRRQPQQVLDYYAARPNLEKLTLERDLPRMSYEVVPHAGGTPVTGAAEITKLFAPEQESGQLNSSIILLRMANQSLFADAAEAVHRLIVMPHDEAGRLCLAATTKTASFRLDLGGGTLDASCELSLGTLAGEQVGSGRLELATATIVVTAEVATDGKTCYRFFQQVREVRPAIVFDEQLTSAAQAIAECSAEDSLEDILQGLARQENGAVAPGLERKSGQGLRRDLLNATASEGGALAAAALSRVRAEVMDAASAASTNIGAAVRNLRSIREQGDVTAAAVRAFWAAKGADAGKEDKDDDPFLFPAARAAMAGDGAQKRQL